jgi:MoxR-like ATPase
MKNSKLQTIRDALNQKFYERSELIDGALTALLCKEHILQIGPPGTAKSSISRAICAALTGSTYFEWLMSKFTVPEELFGPLSLKGLEQDKYTRVMSGKLPKASIVFLDEIFKSGSSIRNTLLSAMNERVIHDDGVAVDIPLLTMFAASNEIPQDEESLAFFDRFVFKFHVDYVKEDASMEALFTNHKTVSVPTLTLKDLKDEQSLAKAVNVSADIIKILMKLRREINNEGILVSDRKWVQVIDAIKAYAHLNGNRSVTDSDLMILCHILWSATEQRSKIRRIVARVSNPVGEKILQILDAVTDLERGITTGKLEPIESFKKVKHALKELDKLGDANKNQALDSAMKKVKAVQQNIAKNHLGLED